MQLVVDTNIIIAALIKDSTIRHLLSHLEIDLLTIGFSDIEILKYKSYITKKAEITEKEFDILLEKIRNKLIILDDLIVLQKMEEAKKIMDKIDKNDTPFIALALATNSDIWSDDKHFEKQNKVKVWKTSDLVNKYLKI